MTTDIIPVEELGRIKVYSEHSAPVPLAKIWDEKRAALIFIRHFG